MTEGQSWYGEAVAGQAARRPKAPAILSAEGTISYAALHRSIERMAAALLARGCRPGQPAALLLGKRPIDLILLFGAHRLGVPVLVLGRDDPPHLARALIAAAGASLLVSTVAEAPPAPGVPVHLADAAWLHQEAEPLPPPPGPDGQCFLVRSSGTTRGVPKLVATTHRSETMRVARSLTRLPLAPSDRFLALLSFHFAYGRSWAQRSLMRGAGVVVPPPLRSLDDLTNAVAALGATWTALTPGHLHDLMAKGAGPAPLLPGLRIVVGTAALPPADRLAVMARISPDIHVMYGANEVGSLTLAGPDDIRHAIGTAGRPDPGTDMEVVDAGGTPLPSGTVGILRFRSPNFPTAYRQSVAGATSRFEDGWFHPGDLGMIDETGRLFLKGRIDDLINVGGLKVYPVDIEDCLCLHPDVTEVAAVGLPHPRLGQVPAAGVVLGAPISITELADHCRRILGPERSPRHIVRLPALPRTEIGKIDRLALRGLLWGDGGPV